MSRPPVPPAASDLVRTIAPGVDIPLLGLGVWELVKGRAGERAIVAALAAGYRHIDTAQGYDNEKTVGKAVRASGIPREQIFVTTKFYPGRADSLLEAERSVERLGLGPVDLYLVHDPRRDPVWAWAGMEAALARGLTRSIGVSNFAPADLDALLRSRRFRRPSTSSSSTRSPTAAHSPRPARRAGSRWRPTARSRTAPTWPIP